MPDQGKQFSNDAPCMTTFTAATLNIYPQGFWSTRVFTYSLDIILTAPSYHYNSTIISLPQCHRNYCLTLSSLHTKLKSNLRSSNKKLLKQDITNNFPQLWNNLPITVTNENNTNTFKSKLHKYLLGLD